MPKTAQNWREKIILWKRCFFSRVNQRHFQHRRAKTGSRGLNQYVYHHHYHHNYHILASSIWFVVFFSEQSQHALAQISSSPYFSQVQHFICLATGSNMQISQKLCFFLIWVNIGLGKMFIMNLVLQVLRVSWNIIGDSSSGVAPIFLITILNDYHSHHFKWSPLQCIVIIITSCRDHHHHHILEWLIVVLRNILNSA